MYLVRAGGPDGVAWVAARTGLATTPGARSIVAVRGEVIRAGVVLDGWTQNSARIHFALDAAPAGRSLMGEVFRYAFRDATRKRPGDGAVGLLIGEIRSDNKRALRIADWLGFELEGRIRGVYGTADLMVMVLRREAWERTQQERKAA